MIIQTGPDQIRYVLVALGQAVDAEHAGVLFESWPAACEVRDDVNMQTTTGDPLEVVEVIVRPIRFFGRDRAWQFIKECRRLRP